MTGLFILGVLLLITGYDLWTLLARGVETTISRVVRHAGEAWPPLLPLTAFAMGCLYGHFFL